MNEYAQLAEMVKPPYWRGLASLPIEFKIALGSKTIVRVRVLLVLLFDALAMVFVACSPATVTWSRGCKLYINGADGGNVHSGLDELYLVKPDRDRGHDVLGDWLLKRREKEWETTQKEREQFLSEADFYINFAKNNILSISQQT